MFEAVMAMTTTNTEREAKKLASLIVDARLAACVQIVPKIHSIYRWEGQIHDDQEYLLLIKTGQELIEKLKRLMEKNHSYEVPEFLVVPIVDGTENYLEWMSDVTK
jgi:periplasmic divalent cation tolerance protein